MNERNTPEKIRLRIDGCRVLHIMNHNQDSLVSIIIVDYTAHVVNDWIDIQTESGHFPAGDCTQSPPLPRHIVFVTLILCFNLTLFFVSWMRDALENVRVSYTIFCPTSSRPFKSGSVTAGNITIKISFLNIIFSQTLFINSTTTITNYNQLLLLLMWY